MHQQVIAHRGYSMNRTNIAHEGFVENTAECIQISSELGVGMVEIDIQMTLDGKFLVFHDDCVNNGEESHMLSEMTYQNLLAFMSTTSELYRNVTASSDHIDDNEYRWIPDTTYFEFVKLETLLEKFYEMDFNIEVKIPKHKADDYEFKFELIQRLNNLMSSLNENKKRYVYSSFDLPMCILLKAFGFKAYWLIKEETNSDVEHAIRMVRNMSLDGLVVHADLFIKFSTKISDLDHKISLWTYGRWINHPLVSRCIVDLPNIRFTKTGEVEEVVMV